MRLPVKIYRTWLGQLKEQIEAQKLRTTLQVNAGMLLLYWYIGKQIHDKIDKEGWGTKVIDLLSADLQNSFPDKQGFSVRNLLYMKQFAGAYPEFLITQPPVAQLQKTRKNTITQPAVAQFENKDYIFSNPLLASITWTHHVTLLDKIIDEEERIWYMQKIVENNWSRAVLQYQIETNLYHRQHKVKKLTNFHLTLPKPQSDLANQMLKDPYKFDFLQIGEKNSEHKLEKELVKHIQEFLVELGTGFAFVGRQIKLKAGRKEYFSDLLFYHLMLRCFVVIDLKMDEFEMEHAGKMNGYLNMVNKQFRHKNDHPSIGIILCGFKDDIDVDFALQNINHPIGVSEYTFVKSLPKALRDNFPSAKQLQTEVKKFLRKQSSKKL